MEIELVILTILVNTSVTCDSNAKGEGEG